MLILPDEELRLEVAAFFDDGRPLGVVFCDLIKLLCEI
jgi:hypothetical protein